MTYIHEGANWPEMIFDPSAAHGSVLAVHRSLGRLHGKLDALGFDVQNELLLNSVSDEVVASSEIEGEKLNSSSVRSSIAKRLGLETAGVVDAPINNYTEYVVEMTLDATQNYALPATEERLFGWHAALFPTGRSGIRRIIVGAYRVEEMSIVSGAIGRERIHYRAPAAERVPGEMKRFLEWLEAKQNIDPYVKAGIAHLWFESIHPFDDGNGRIGRAIVDLLLARAENNPKRYYSLSSQFLIERKAYYDELEAATSNTGSIDRWLAWFLGCLLRAVEASEEKLGLAKRKAMFYGRLRKVTLNERQLSMLNRLTDGFQGKLTTSKWAKICKCSHDTALRDIEYLVGKGVLSRSAEGGRSTSYDLVQLAVE